MFDPFELKEPTPDLKVAYLNAFFQRIYLLFTSEAFQNQLKSPDIVLYLDHLNSKVKYFVLISLALVYQLDQMPLLSQNLVLDHH